MKEIKFEDIRDANKTIITLNVKGKDYAQVNERIKAFRIVYPQGTIETEMLSNENGICIFKATTTNGEGIVLGTGHAYEKEGSTFINKTSYIENCETSAIGRALGMAGFGIDTSVCSAEEVQNAIAQQNEPLDDKAKLLEQLENLIIETETDLDAIKSHYKVNTTTEMSIMNIKEAIEVLQKKVK